MKIHCLTTFLDGTRRFEAGDVCQVSDEDGARYVTHGWAAPHHLAEAEPVDLAIKNSVVGVADTSGA